MGQQPATPPTQITTTSLDPSTPSTYNTLKRQADDMEGPDAPPLSTQFRKFIKGSLTMAAELAITKDKLAHVHAAKRARTTHQQANRQQVQNGGVMYASEAWAITEKQQKDKER